MRILIATSSRNLVGGVERYLGCVIPELLRGHHVGLLYELPLRDGPRVDSPADSVPAWCLADSGAASIVAGAADWRPDIVYCHGLDHPELESALLDRYPCVLYTHSYNGVCVSGRKCHAFPRIEPCQRALGPGCLAQYHLRRCGGLNPLTMFRMYRDQSDRLTRIERYSQVLVASRHMQQEFARYGTLRNRVTLLPLPLTDEVSVPVRADRTPGGRLLYLGRLVDVKGVDLLIEAVPDAARRLGFPLTLTIAGDGPDCQKLAELAQRLNVSAEFTGWVNGAEKLAALQQADLLVVPSRWPEPFGLVGIEAGCLGVPSVGFAVGGIPDWLIAGQSGELAPGDPPTREGLADAIVRALSSRVHYNRLCAGAQRSAERFSMPKHLNELESILSRLTRGLPTADGENRRENFVACAERRP